MPDSVFRVSDSAAIAGLRVPSSGNVVPLKPLPKVAILLCTYHGQHFLSEQLESFYHQTYPNWEVWASDDGSEDDTHAILERYRLRFGDQRLSIHSGPAEGFVANFLSLACKAGIRSDFYAFSDQDDIWKADKLERAVRWLSRIPADVPALYCSRTEVVDAGGGHLGYSPLFLRPPSFANALVQNIGGGNTMVFNQAARNLLQYAGPDIAAVSHDWWAYLVVTACGGRVHYDPVPTIRYRQHGDNLVGANSSWRARAVRSQYLLKGRFRDWNEQNLAALQRMRAQMTDSSIETLDRFERARKQGLPGRLLGMIKAGVYRQTLLGNLGLIVATIFKKC